MTTQKRSLAPESSTSKLKRLRESESAGGRAGYGVDEENSSEGRFVWRKKYEALAKEGIHVTEDDIKRQAEEARLELEHEKKAREQRDRERKRREEERRMEMREKMEENYRDLEDKEEEFNVRQYYLRQAIRLREGRPTLVDRLAQNLRCDLKDIRRDEGGPLRVIDSLLQTDDVNVLLEEVKDEQEYLQWFDRNSDNGVFNDAVRKDWWRMIEILLEEAISHEGDRIHPSVKKDVDSLIGKKSPMELRKLRNEVKEAIENNEGDADFWITVEKKISTSLASNRLKLLDGLLKREKRDVEPHKEKKETEDRPDSEELEGERAEPLGRDEEVFFDEIRINTKPKTTQGWGKYKPRKPKYHNRVHTGYDWNKYNRTHYDHDNPPPKTVQGYKFNIFYPDLIDKSVAPSFSIMKTENPEIAILKFTAGPPYEDIAFKIVNREWEHSHKRGYRCSFERGTLHLWFNFKRYRYRR